jgi:transposase
MTSVTRLRNRRTHPRHLADGQFVAGVDTHKDVHVFAVLDAAGRLVATGSVPTTTAGYAALLAHCRKYGDLAFVGVEGTSSWGAGLTRFLLTEGVSVLEVERQNRQARRRLGKTDTLDAENAARAVLSGHATTTPKTQDGTIEAIRVLRVTRRGARRARTVAQAQLLSVINTAPQDLRDQLRHLSPTTLIVHCTRLRPRPVLPDPAGCASVPDATKMALVSLAKRIQQLDEEIRELDKTLTRLVKAAAPGLHELHGVGTETAGALLVTAGDNPERLRNSSSFAALCGVSPVSASSGKYQRHRLSRGGDRNANSALWRITLVRMNSHPPTRAYVARRSAEGMSKPEIMRCLKRYIAREIYQHLPRPPAEEATD